MKIHAYLLCYNEEKIIKNILDYYSSFCSKIFLMDNMSTDNSVDIAKKYNNVVIIPWKNNGYIDESLYVKMKSQTFKSYSREGGKYTTEVADWIISCDIDEVLYHPNLIEVLKEYKKSKITVPQITGFNVVGEKNIEPNKSIISQYKKGVRAKQFDKRIIFDCNFDISYSVGCHPSGFGFEYMKRTYNYKTSNKFPIALLHYKHIGERFYEAGLKNVDRLNPENITIDSNGNAKGMGSHYHSIKSGKFQKIKEINAKDLFDNDANIQFKNFSKTTGEVGVGNRLFSLNETDIDSLRDIAFELENTNYKNKKIIIDLLKIAHKLRPKGLLIEKRLLNLLKKNK